MGPTSCAAMATGSPTGPGWCPSERAGGALLGKRGGRKVGGDGEGQGLSCQPPQTSAPTSPGPLPGRSYLPRQGYLRAAPKFHRLIPTARSSGCRPWGSGACIMNTLRPALLRGVPGTAGQLPSPAPLPAFSGIVRRYSPWLWSAAPRSPSLIQQFRTRCYPRWARAPQHDCAAHKDPILLGCTPF